MKNLDSLAVLELNDNEMMHCDGGWSGEFYYCVIKPFIKGFADGFGPGVDGSYLS